MIYARIDLSKTNYEVIPEYKKLKLPIPKTLEAIYNAYCIHKKFKSVMPIFDEEYYDDKNEVFGYYNKEEKLVAFSLLRCYNSKTCGGNTVCMGLCQSKFEAWYQELA